MRPNPTTPLDLLLPVHLSPITHTRRHLFSSFTTPRFKHFVDDDRLHRSSIIWAMPRRGLCISILLMYSYLILIQILLPWGDPASDPILSPQLQFTPIVGGAGVGELVHQVLHDIEAGRPYRRHECGLPTLEDEHTRNAENFLVLYLTTDKPGQKDQLRDPLSFGLNSSLGSSVMF